MTTMRTDTLPAAGAPPEPQGQPDEARVEQALAEASEPAPEPEPAPERLEEEFPADEDEVLLASCDLSVRTINALHAAEITTVRELQQRWTTDRRGVEGLRGVGAVAVKEIRELLAEDQQAEGSSSSSSSAPSTASSAPDALPPRRLRRAEGGPLAGVVRNRHESSLAAFGAFALGCHREGVSLEEGLAQARASLEAIEALIEGTGGHEGG